MSAFRSRLVHVTLREILLLAIAAAGAILFINHEILYLGGGFEPRADRPEAYLLVTLILYLFVRGIDLVVRIRAPRIQGNLVLCPECGQELDDGTPRGSASSQGVAGTPHLSTSDLISSIALRKAVHEARHGAGSRAREDPLIDALRGKAENEPVGDSLFDLAPPRPGRPTKVRWRAKEP